MQISSELVNDTLLVTWSNYQINQGLSLVIDAVDQLSAVRFFDGSGNEMFPQSQVASYGETRYCQFVYDESFEVCNGIDDDGDGNIDENLAIAQYADTDQDGYGDPAVMINQCTLLPGYVTNNEDCNDQSTVVHPATWTTIVMATLMKVLLGVRFIQMVMLMDLAMRTQVYQHVWRQTILFYSRVIVMMRIPISIPMFKKFAMT
jgi:hypothetical protein